MTWKYRGRSSFLFIIGLLMSGFLVTACGGNSDGDSAASLEKGEVVLSLTDAEGDFEKYEVEIRSIRLTKQNGDIVETLPETTRIDFAQYVEMEEILTTASIPLGRYTEATMVLDYTNADIQVEVGEVSKPAVVQDENGNALGTLEVRVKLDTKRPLVVAPGLIAHLSLDFDLNATHEVDTGLTPPVVTVRPVLIADVNPDFDDLKKHRLRGPLVRVDETEESFQLGIRPFRHRIHRDGRHFGHLKVVTSSETTYEVDGVTGEGREGFKLLAQKPLLTAVIVLGELNVRNRTFKAQEVLAGSSVPGGDLDAVRGSVTARNGDTLTVRGASLIRGEGRTVLHRDVRVLLGEETHVTKQGHHRDESDPLSKDDISVGQGITVFGRITGTETEGLSIDATVGRVRMTYTSIAGTVKGVRTDEGELEMVLSFMNGRPIAIYDFTGTGSSPAAYVVSTRSLGLAEISEGDPVQLRGHVAPFGSAPPDFTAQTVIDVKGVNASMAIHWDPASASPFLSSSEAGLELDLNGVGRLHHVFRSRFATALTPEPAPWVLPKENGRGRYAIRQGRTISVHSDFGNFVNDLNQRLDGDGVLDRLHARGRYTGLNQTMTARRVTVGLQ